MMDRNGGLGKELVCVLFPGNVKNEDKAIQCLGGIKMISQICARPSKKPLTLSFQPENPCIKKINGDVKSSAGVLLKVKIRKINVDGKIKTEVLNTACMGHVKRIYKYETMCDFQYLPITNTSKPECLLDQIIPSGLDSLKFMEEPAPLYIVPGSFVRFDKPINYFYTDKRAYISKNDEPLMNVSDKDEVHKMRSERGIPIPKYTFNLIDDLPTEPHEYYLEAKNAKILIYPQFNDEYEAVKKMFNERPVWSFNHIKHHTKIKTANLKIILPCLALYNRNGPWKMLWIRLGYDPRKDPYARYYQTLDFRLRHTAGVYSCVSQDQVGVKKDRSKRMPADDTSEEIIPEGAVYFKPNIVPAQRQIFYMYCDIQVPEVQEILSVEPPTGYQCHPKRGWLPVDTAHTCRDIIFNYLKQSVIENKNADLKFEQASSEEDSNSEDEAACTADASIRDIDDSL